MKSRCVQNPEQIVNAHTHSIEKKFTFELNTDFCVCGVYEYQSMKARRQQELEQMVNYELKLGQVAEENQRALELERQKEMLRQREAQKRQKQW